MNCPACGRVMNAREFFGVEIDICSYCGGAWFDSHELADYIQKGSIPNALLIPSIIENVDELRQEGERFCPRCGNLLTVEKHREINIDFCYRCYGVWFDNGELRQLLLSYKREADIRELKRKKSRGTSTTGKDKKGKPADSEKDLFDEFMEKPHEAPAGFWLVFSGDFSLEREIIGNASVEQVARAIPRGSTTRKLIETGPVPAASSQDTGNSMASRDDKVTDPQARQALKDFFGSLFYKMKTRFKSGDIDMSINNKKK